MKAKILKTTGLLLLACFFFSVPTWAATSTSYELYSINNSGYYGLKGDFKLPTTNPVYDSTKHPYNKINFEEWFQVNRNSDWFEIGYKNGDLADGSGNTSFWNGFFKSKMINGVYGCDKLVRDFSVGTTYTFTIVDVNKTGLYEIYIGQTYFGSFADKVSPAPGGSHDMGIEATNDGSTQSIGNTTITNTMYYGVDSNNKTVWMPWSNLSPSRTHDSPAGISASYDSKSNTITFSK